MIVLLSAGVALLAFIINLEINADISQIRQAATDQAEAVSTMAESLLALQMHRQELIAERLQAGREGSAMTPREAEIAKSAESSMQQFEKDGLGEARKQTLELISAEERQGHTDEIRKAREGLSLLDQIATSFSILKKDLENNLLRPECQIRLR